MIEVQAAQGARLIRISSASLDASNIDDFKQAVEPHATARQNLVIDLSQVNFIDSSGLGGLVWMLRRVEQTGNEIRLASVTPPVQTLLEMVRMHRIFRIHADVQQAVQAAHAQPKGEGSQQ